MPSLAQHRTLIEPASDWGILGRRLRSYLAIRTFRMFVLSKLRDSRAGVAWSFPRDNNSNVVINVNECIGSGIISCSKECGTACGRL